MPLLTNAGNSKRIVGTSRIAGPSTVAGAVCPARQFSECDPGWFSRPDVPASAKPSTQCNSTDCQRFAVMGRNGQPASIPSLKRTASVRPTSTPRIRKEPIDGCSSCQQKPPLAHTYTLNKKAVQCWVLRCHLPRCQRLSGDSRFPQRGIAQHSTN